MIRCVLVANRGEIALRILRACDELEIATVAVDPDADEGAPHVFAAGQAVRIGPAQPAESYLSAGRILEAARSTGADAIHPGYGFLAENADFAAACESAGMTFIGPPSAAIAAMGSQDLRAPADGAGAGMQVVPGETPRNQSDPSLEAAARRAGFPLLVKASVGGGGKGMHVVREPTTSRRPSRGRHEAHGYFGDRTVFVERLVRDPAPRRGPGDRRHARRHGPPGRARLLGPATASEGDRGTPFARRDRRVAYAVGCGRVAAATTAATSTPARSSASGVGDDGHFYFLEMNTHLQVEHTVTEAVTGTDLVQAQIRVAAGLVAPGPRRICSSAGTRSSAACMPRTPRPGISRMPGASSCTGSPSAPAFGSMPAWSKARTCRCTTIR